jgi:LysM repeat protein
MSRSVRGSLFLGLFIIVALPVLAYATRGSSIFSRTPEVSVVKNSQTMTLLEAPKNYDPISRSGGQLAIVDNNALSIGNEPAAYADGGLSGSGQISVYIVRRGDTLAGIAKMFNVSKNTILWANDIKNGTIKEGQELVILPVTGVRHIVKSGDTLKSISTKYKADINDILAYNDLAANAKLKVGNEVIIPDGEISVSATSKAASVKAAASYPSVAGYFIRPANAVKTQGIHGHNGVDFGGPIGTSIKAAASGTVTVARSGGYNGGYGSYVVISHPNGTQTLYAHMSSVGVSVGQKIGQGEYIGAIGNTGKSTGPHLHFEVRGAKNPF